MFSLLLSFIVYVIVSYLLAEPLSEYFDKGMLKNIVIFLIASLISWLVGSTIDWIFPAQSISLL